MRALLRFYRMILASYVFMVMDTGCWLSGHRLLCFNRPAPANRLFTWPIDHDFVGMRKLQR